MEMFADEACVSRFSSEEICQIWKLLGNLQWIDERVASSLLLPLTQATTLQREHTHTSLVNTLHMTISEITLQGIVDLLYGLARSPHDIPDSQLSPVYQEAIRMSHMWVAVLSDDGFQVAIGSRDMIIGSSHRWRSV